MANGAVLKFNSQGCLGLLNYFLNDWRSFEGWCVAQGCNPQEESARRTISLMMYFIEKDLTEEGRDQFRSSIYSPQTKKRHLKAVPDGTKTVVPVTKRWKAPPGWTPPNWDESKSYANAMSFMGFQANPK